MPETSHSITKEPVSARRRQQNVQAQQRYRERQKLRMRALEDMMENSSSMIHSVEHHRPSEIATGGTSSNERSQTSADFHPALTADDPALEADLLSLVVSMIGSIPDTDVKHRLSNLTLRDMIYANSKARLAGQSVGHTNNAKKQSIQQQDLQGKETIRTDLIVIPDNKMRIHTHTLPDVYINRIHLKQFALAAAFRANGEHLGVNFDILINPDSESPFPFIPSESNHYPGHAVSSSSGVTARLITTTTTTTTTTATTATDSSTPSFGQIKPHLRPTQTQLHHPHHPWVDVIPCPVFRERFLELAAADPPLVDEYAVCNDLASGGLICWGSTAGPADDATGAGAPWDIRSWEAQPWFLRKWGFLFGGAEGALYRQTRWWHEFRGDQLGPL